MRSNADEFENDWMRKSEENITAAELCLEYGLDNDNVPPN